MNHPAIGVAAFQAVAGREGPQRHGTGSELWNLRLTRGRFGRGSPGKSHWAEEEFMPLKMPRVYESS